METLLFLGFENISDWATGGAIVVVAGMIATFFRKRGINLKSIFKKASVITKEIGEALLESSEALSKADEAFKADGHLKENSVKEVIEAGKEAILEWKDVIMVIKPKKKPE